MQVNICVGEPEPGLLIGSRSRENIFLNRFQEGVRAGKTSLKRLSGAGSQAFLKGAGTGAGADKSFFLKKKRLPGGGQSR